MNSFVQKLKALESTPILLGNVLGNGGEGTVYSVQNSYDFAIKKYHKEPNSDKTGKILSMIAGKNPELLEISAWPLASYYTQNKLAGFVLQKLNNHSSLYELYNPSIRLNKFPQADWRFLVHAAANVARAFKTIHNFGHVVGDVNHGNILVAQDATVKFIDTDSFQLYLNNKYWPCLVGVSSHQPPEMQGISNFNRVIRSPNHDNFGLAVLIFQLIFLGRHPFAGIFKGQGEMPIEKAITEFRFAYSDSKTTQMLPPPATLPISSLPTDIKILFERAFSKDGYGSNVGLRPTPEEWITSLTALISNLKSCSSNGGHFFYNKLQFCPWCELETKNKITFFRYAPPKKEPASSSPRGATSSQINPNSTTELDMKALWNKFESRSRILNEVMPSSLDPRLSPSVESISTGNRIQNLKIYCVVFCVICFFMIILSQAKNAPDTVDGLNSLLLLSSGITGITSFVSYLFYQRKKEKLLQNFLNTITISREKSNELIVECNKLSKNSCLLELQNKIINLKNSLDTTTENQKKQIQEIQKKQLATELNTFLKMFVVELANIEGIGIERKKILKSHGIITAVDIDAQKIADIRGFGEIFRKRLLDWRAELEKTFNLKSKPNTNFQFDNIILQKYQSIQKELTSSIHKFINCSSGVIHTKEKLLLKAQKNIQIYSQVVVDIKYLGMKNVLNDHEINCKICL